MEIPIYFDQLDWKESNSQKKEYLLENLLWILETEEIFADLREEEVYCKLVQQIQEEQKKTE